MGHEDPLRAAFTDGLLQPGPIGMIRQHEAAIAGTPSSCAAQRHPARGEGIARIGESAQPACAGGRGRRQHQGTRERLMIGRPSTGHSAGRLAHQGGLGQADPGGAIDTVERLDGAMADDRANRGIDAGQDALRLAEGIAIKNACATRSSIGRPPGIDLGKDLRRCRPAVDRQAEGRLAHEGLARHRLERLAGGIRLQLVVTAHHPDLAAMLDAHLRRTQHMACRMQ